MLWETTVPSSAHYTCRVFSITSSDMRMIIEVKHLVEKCVLMM
jgi:hypothetical protein